MIIIRKYICEAAEKTKDGRVLKGEFSHPREGKEPNHEPRIKFSYTNTLNKAETDSIAFDRNTGALVDEQCKRNTDNWREFEEYGRVIAMEHYDAMRIFHTTGNTEAGKELNDAFKTVVKMANSNNKKIRKEFLEKVVKSYQLQEDYEKAKEEKKKDKKKKGKGR